MTDALAGQAVEAQWPARELNPAKQQHYDLRVLGSSGLPVAALPCWR